MAHPKQQCTARRKRDGQQCTRWAQKGYTVCRVHGAGSKARPGGRPIQTGRYSRLKREALRTLYQEYLGDPEPLHLYDELAMLRALVQDFVERYDAWRDALLAWHVSWAWQPHPDDPEALPPVAAQKPREVLDITDVYRILAEIGRMAERIDTMQKGATLTARDVANLMERMALVVETHVTDETVKERIRDAWRNLLTV
jgi:hypothetical protein